MVLGAIIGAAASLGAGFMGRSAQKKAQAREADRQREFAQHGIQWKADDARRAGIHPLYALGAPTTSYQPQQIGGDPLAAGVQNMGQDISRAADAVSGPRRRAAIYDKAAQALALEHAGLRNDLLRSQIQRMNQAGQPIGPPGTEGEHFPSRVAVPAGHKMVPPEFVSPGMIVGGQRVRHSPRWSNAQTFEDRYGEGADWVVGPFIGAADAWNTFKGTKFYRSRSKRAKRTLTRSRRIYGR